MTTKAYEDELLRSVALQNASSILIARQRAERRNEAYLAEAQRLSHTGSFGWRLATGEILWSEETFRIFQYDQTTKPTVELVLQRVHPEDAAFVKQIIMRASQDGKDFDFEYRLLMPDGFVKHVHVVAHALRDESGGIEFFGAVMDVTAQHQAKAALEKAFDEIKKSEDHLQLVIDTIPGMVWSGLPDGTFDFVNQPWLRYLGCSWEELSARGGLVSVVHPDDVEGSIDRWKTTRTTGTHTDHELRMRRADGQYRWFLTRALPLRDDQGRIVRWYGTATDIQDRKGTEEALRQSEEQWRDVFENNPTMYFVVDSAGTVMAVNPFGAQQLGYNVAELVGQPVLRVTLDVDREVVQQNVARCFEQLGRASNWEARQVRKDGEVIWVRETAKAVSRVTGPIVLIACEDITEKKRAEQALEDLAGRLISAQEEERKRIGRELHDHISQRLGVLTIRVDQLRANRGIAPDIGDALEELRLDTTEVTDDVHRLSHRLHSSTLDYLGLVPALRKLVSEFAARHDIAIQYVPTSMPPSLPSEVALCLFRVAEESLTNIAKHSKARSAHVHVTGAPDGIHLTVEDAGCGFDVAAFGSKAGLGFVSMQERLRVLHGTIHVDSAPSRGTRIEAWVPTN